MLGIEVAQSTVAKYMVPRSRQPPSQSWKTFLHNRAAGIASIDIGNDNAKPDGTHSNTVESAFSLLKRGIYGTFHNVSRKHLHRYVEFDFRWNVRKVDNGERCQRGLNGDPLVWEVAEVNLTHLDG
jgi:ISXO2-like transposase domain